MPIVGFNFTNMQAKKASLINKQIKIISNCSITNLKEEKLPTGKTKTDGLRFEFKFHIKYEPKFGEILLEGYIFYMEDPKILKGIMSQWKKDKSLSKDIMTLIINTILLRSTVRALNLAQTINLPPHIPLPAVSPKANPKDYIG